MTLAEEIFDEMKCGRHAMFAIGLAAIANESPDRLLAALRSALEMYRMSNYHELGPVALAASTVTLGGKRDVAKVLRKLKGQS